MRSFRWQASPPPRVVSKYNKKLKSIRMQQHRAKYPLPSKRRKMEETKPKDAGSAVAAVQPTVPVANPASGSADSAAKDSMKMNTEGAINVE